MRAPSVLVLGLAVSAASPAPSRPAYPEPAWSRVRSRHFEVLTDAGGPLAIHAAERLEQLRLALRQPFPPRTEGERRIVILLLASQQRFEPLVPRRHPQAAKVAGFFQGGGEWDTIVARLGVGERGPFAALDHEYAHVVLNRSLPAQPVWVAEGFAELLSDAVFDAGEARLGAGQAEHEAVVRESRAPLLELLRVRHDSREYLGAGSDDGLYDRCWALARWVLARHGLPGLRSFLEAVAEGQDPIVAFEEHLGSIEQVQRQQLDVPSGPLLRIAREHDAAEVALQADTPSRAEVDERLGELLLQGGEPERAKALFEGALAVAPDDVPARIGLVAVHLRSGEWAEARHELERALALAPGDPHVLLYDARLRHTQALAEGEPLAPAVEERLVGQLERALAAAPDLYEAALLLAELRPQPYARRLAALVPVFDQDPGRSEVARAVAALYVKQRDLASAGRVLLRARDAAVDPAYRFLCEHLLEQLGAYAAETVEVHGRLVELRCRPDGSLRFTVDAGASGLLWLEAASRRSFLVYGETEASGETELVCGLQDRALVVRYRRGGTLPGVAGSVVWLTLAGRGGD